jgi:hypothetical protein
MRFGIFHDNRLHSQDPVSHSVVHPPAGDIKPLLADLLTTRAEYETLRVHDGPLGERAQMITRLQGLRADLARARQETV